ncbi:hypothetical protein [Marinobacter changyiensis]|uniref:hypothetical protein n=1 Tax=Marinobacter changyiensis TaxID=2604091 RepID=UPI00126558C5|nr:hypothetical protein [Marinobacter changyiensis]
MNTRAAIKRKGWTQGACFTTRDLPDPSVLPDCYQDDEFIFIVVTHACTVVYENFEEEPYIEVLAARRIDNPVGIDTNLKNTRRLSTTLFISEEENPIHLFARDRFFLPRRLLLEFESNPVIHIPPGRLTTIKNWLVLRFTNLALPDSFNDRVDGRPMEKLRKLLSKNPGHACENLYLKLNYWDELDEHSDYSLAVLIVYSEEIYAEQEEDIEICAERMNNILDDIPGINLESCDVLTDDAVTLKMLRMGWKRWSLFDQVSVKKDTPAKFEP